MARYKVCITSVGSLLGQNLLDALESRRDLVRIVGTDAGVIHPRIFQCDTLYLAPPVESEELYRARLREIISTEAPDLVLPARDPDILALCDLVAMDPKLLSRIPMGSRAAAEIMNDKWLSHQFAQRHGLPFVESLLVEAMDSREALERLVARHGYPLIAKPQCGSGSVGVRVLLGPEHIAEVALMRGYVVQPYIGETPAWLSAPGKDSAGVPLFTVPQPLEQVACQAVIGPDGQLASIFSMHVTLVAGRVEGVRLVTDAEWQCVGEAYAAAIAREGWRGAFNVQMRIGRDGRYSAFEMNGRMTGSTSARLRLGGDDIGELVQAWQGPSRLPCLTKKISVARSVKRRPADAVMLDADVDVLQTNKVWHASS